MKNTIKNLILWSSFILIMGTALAYGVYNLAVFIENPVPVYAMAEVSVPANNPIKSSGETYIREWVMQEVRKAGLSEAEADCIIDHESNWNVNAYGVNKNGTMDAGLWQINEIHKLSMKDKFDYKTATKWAINKRLRDGSWNAWTTWKSCK